MAAPATVTETPLLGLGFSQMENFKSPVNALPLAMKVSLLSHIDLCYTFS